MIDYRKYTLANGLTLLTHEAWDTPLASLCLLYNVGSRDEEPSRTGFAHLFEHLMFGGTHAVPDFDAAVNSLGGECNAFTNCDYTCYYMTVPADALDTALALEADRMTGLEINEKTLGVQQRVVTEEYHQRYMNQPYGDVWLLLRPLCYKVHPYRWATIGADIRHVSEATLDDVRAFHDRYYRPDNAILSVAAPMKHEEILRKVESEVGKVGRITTTPGNSSQLSTITEPEQTAPRILRVQRAVPATKVFLAYPICPYGEPLFRAYDLITDILGNGTSSRMYRQLVVDSNMMTEADAYLSGDNGPGLLVLSGTLSPGVTPEEGIEALRGFEAQMSQFGADAANPEPCARCSAVGSAVNFELAKVQNKYENTFVFSQYKASDRALGLCHYTWLGDTSLVNLEPELYRRVTVGNIQTAARTVFQPQKENILIYEAEGQNN